MLRNYLTVAIRNLLRQRVYTLINVFGLSVGMTACVLIGLYVLDELRFDRHHEKADRIYRVIRGARTTEGETSNWTNTSGLLGSTMEKEFPEVGTAARIGFSQTVRIDHGGEIRIEFMRAIDASLFDVFTIPFEVGDAVTAFENPYSLVITRKSADRLFPDKDPIGQRLKVDSRYYGGEYTITGILADPPTTSDIRLDFLTTTLSGEEPQRLWNNWQKTYTGRPAETWVVLRSPDEAVGLERKMAVFAERHLGKEVSSRTRYYLQPLLRMRLYSHRDYGFYPASIDQIILLVGIAGLLLLIGAMNFVNMSTARSALRAREVGVRRVVGGRRIQLVRQFLGESVIVALLGSVVGFGLAELALPRFNAFILKDLSISGGGGVFLLAFAAFTVLIGLLAGLYPAIRLSRIQPVAALRGTDTGAGGQRLRQMLVLVQFAISIGLIVATDVAGHQLRFLGDQRLGFNADRVVMMPVFTRDRQRLTNPDLTTWLASRYQAVKFAFGNHPNIVDVSALRFTIGTGMEMQRTLRIEGHGDRQWTLPVQEVDEDFLAFFDIELLAGRNFTAQDPARTQLVYILNESAVRTLGWTPADAVGKSIEWLGTDYKPGVVLGVVRDYHHRSLYHPVEPHVLIYRHFLFSNIAVRLGPGPIEESMDFLEETWKEFVPETPFTYDFLDERLASMYDGERRFQNIVGLFSGLAILLACIGLLGLTSFTIQRRTKEIGIRKVLGASTTVIVRLLSTEFLILVALANVLAIPSAAWFLERWLDAFAYRIALGPGSFAFAALLALSVVSAVMIAQALRATRLDPVQALRDE